MLLQRLVFPGKFFLYIAKPASVYKENTVDLCSVLCGGSQDKTAEQFPHFRGGAVHTFRMPLYAPGKAAAGQADAFDEPVRGGVPSDAVALTISPSPI